MNMKEKLEKIWERVWDYAPEEEEEVASLIL